VLHEAGLGVEIGVGRLILTGEGAWRELVLHGGQYGTSRAAFRFDTLSGTDVDLKQPTE
jgi:hypothetical protein